jgi:hypothetical protein
MENSPLKNDGRNGEKCMYFVCDFNGRWLKDLSLLCCIAIISSVGGRVRLCFVSRMFL